MISWCRRKRLLSETAAVFATWLVREGDVELVDAATTALNSLADALDEVSEVLEAYASEEGEGR
jgi:hypothetical protein